MNAAAAFVVKVCGFFVRKKNLIPFKQYLGIATSIRSRAGLVIAFYITTYLRRSNIVKCYLRNKPEMGFLMHSVSAFINNICA